MKLCYGLEQNSDFSAGTVATIGNFDGVHLGHQALLAALRIEADKRQLPLVVFLFEPQPGEFFRGQDAPARLSSLREKLDVLRCCKVDYVYCLKFDKHLALMSAENFAQHYLFSLLKVKFLLIGKDFRFGHERGGDLQLLRNLAKKTAAHVQVFSDFLIDSERVSSTRIREILATGQLEPASYLLGRTFSLCGRVIKGAQRGRQWGIPTANFAMHRIKLPLKGVFCVKVRRASGEWLEGVANLGTRPTVDGSKNILEVHFFNFDADLYGEMLQVFFLYKLRDEIKFSSVDALIAQIHDDIAAAKTAFRLRSFEPNVLVE